MAAVLNEWTDPSWRHMRIERVSGRGRFAVRTAYMSNSLGPLAKEFLGVPAGVNLERLSLADAREWGSKIERRLGATARLKMGVESESERNASKDELF